MTEKTGDELIAWFMRNHAINSPHIRKPNYSSDWNELMPVVEKIRDLYSLAFPPGEKFIELILAKKDPIDKHYLDVVALPICAPIDEVNTAVVKFIKWYTTENHSNP